MASQKLQPFFQAHIVEVLINYLLSQVLQKLKALGRILKWAIELSQFDIRYKPRSAIKGQTLVDFLVEFTRGKKSNRELDKDSQKPNLPTWSLYIDGLFNEGG